eukprot:7682542-Pyramimonas_sp.AAC.2
MFSMRSILVGSDRSNTQTVEALLDLLSATRWTHTQALHRRLLERAEVNDRFACTRFSHRRQVPGSTLHASTRAIAISQQTDETLWNVRGASMQVSLPYRTECNTENQRKSESSTCCCYMYAMAFGARVKSLDGRSRLPKHQGG